MNKIKQWFQYLGRGVKSIVISVVNNPTVKRYILSSLTTFTTAFTGALWLSLGLVPTGQAITASFILGILGVAFRAAIKAVVESLFSQHADPIK